MNLKFKTRLFRNRLLHSTLITAFSILLLLLITHPWPILHNNPEAALHRYHSFPFHSAIEAIIGITSILLGFTLWSRKGTPAPEPLRLVALGLWPMGVISLFHAVITEPNEFVSLYSAAVMAGSLGFVLCLFPLPAGLKTHQSIIPWGALAVSAALAILTCSTSSFGFSLIEGNAFTPLARGINFTSGILFTLAALKITSITVSAQEKWIKFLLGAIALTGAAAGFAFSSLQVWSTGWWSHHLLRLAASVATLATLQASRYKIEQERTSALEEKVRLNSELSIKEARLSLALEAAGEGIWDWDLEKNELYYSAEWCEMLGYGKIELRGGPEIWENIVHPEDIAQARKAISEYVSGEIPIYCIELRIKHNKGHYLDILSRGKLIRRDADRKPIRFIGTHADMTEIRKKDKELLLFKMLVEESALGCSFATLDGKISYVNPSLIRFLQAETPQEVLGQDIAYLYPADTRDRIRTEIIPQILSTGEWGGEISLERRDGGILPIMDHFFLVSDSRGDPICFANVMADISAVKKAELELKQAMELNESIVRALPVGIGIYDSELRCSYLNQAYAKTVGLPAEYLLANPDFHLAFWKETEAYENALQALETGKLIRFEDHAVLPSGKSAWLDCSMVSIEPDPQSRLMVLVNDITREKESIQALEENEAKLNEFFDMTGDLVTQLDDQGNIMFLNQACRKILGLSPEECKGLSVFNFIHPEDQEETTSALARWTTERNPTVSLRNRLVSSDGRISEILWSMSLKFDQDGSLVHIWSIARDISEIVSYEMKLEEAHDDNKIEKEFSEKVINSLPGVFFLFDSGLKFQLWNKNFEKLTEYTSEELFSLSPLDLFDQEESPVIAGRIEEVFTRGQSNIETHFLTRNGNRVPIYFTGHLIKIRDKEYLAGIGIDISDRKLLELERERSMEALKERIKEQECVFKVSKAVESSRSMAELSEAIIAAVKGGWKYPEITRCRITVDGLSYTDLEAESGESVLTSKIMIGDRERGSIEVHYMEERPAIEVGPFLEEEKDLLELIAGRIAEAVVFFQNERERLARKNIGRGFLDQDDSNAYSQALEAILNTFSSRHGLLGYVDEDGAMVYPSMPGNIRKDDSGEVPGNRFPRETWEGLWAKALVEKRILVANEDPEVPPWHIQVRNNITAPVLLKDQLVGHISIADRDSDYDQNDIALLKRITAYMAPIIEARRQEHFARRALEMERIQLKTLFDSTDDVIYVSDPLDYRLIYVNKTFHQIWGEEIIGKKCHKVLQDRDEPCPFCTNDRIFGENLGKTYVWEFQNEKTQQWYRCVDKAITWDDGKKVRFELASDITEQKLFASKQIEMEKFSILGQVAAGVAHELNNPLMGVLNYAEYCLEKTEKEDRRHQVLQDIRTETKRCAAIVENLLTASRIDNVTSGNIKAFNPKRVVERVMRLLAYRTSKEGIEVAWDSTPEVSAIEMSQDAFQQLLMNLFTNAIDAVEESRLKKISIEIEDLDDQLVIRFEDTGCGIPHDIRTRIFDPFFTTKAPGKGTGLGLATCWKIVSSRGGKIDCRSRPGLGTTMTVTLPRSAYEGTYEN